MKKMSLLVLILVLALPGCGDKSKKTQPVKRNTIEKNADITGETIELDLDDIDFDDLDLDDLESADYFKSLGLDLDDVDSEDEDEKEDQDEDSTLDVLVEEEAFNWIDAQTDDELRKLYFSFNHYGIRPDQQAAAAYDIEQVKQLLAEADGAQPTVVIEGHACQEGSNLYNLALSEKRAKNVADMFVAAGIDRSAIKVVGRGQECPVALSASREGRAPNRRVEVRVIYT